MIAIIDYGVGNLFSLVSSFHFIGAEATVTADRRRTTAGRSADFTRCRSFCRCSHKAEGKWAWRNGTGAGRSGKATDGCVFGHADAV